MKKFVFKMLAISLVFSCTKDKGLSPKEPPPCIDCFNGYFDIRTTYVSNTSTYNANYAWGELSNIPYNIDLPHLVPIDAGDVYVNGKRLKKESGWDVQYKDTTYTPCFSPFTFSITGSAPIPAFTMTLNKPWPGFGNMAAFPDTLKLSSGFDFTLQGIAEADSFIVSLSSTPYKRVKANITNYQMHYDPSQLTGIINHIAAAGIMFWKHHTLTVNDKKYRVLLVYTFHKTFVVVD